MHPSYHRSCFGRSCFELFRVTLLSVCSQKSIALIMTIGFHALFFSAPLVASPALAQFERDDPFRGRLYLTPTISYGRMSNIKADIVYSSETGPIAPPATEFRPKGGNVGAGIALGYRVTDQFSLKLSLASHSVPVVVRGAASDTPAGDWRLSLAAVSLVFETLPILPDVFPYFEFTTGFVGFERASGSIPNIDQFLGLNLGTPPGMDGPTGQFSGGTSKGGLFGFEVGSIFRSSDKLEFQFGYRFMTTAELTQTSRYTFPGMGAAQITVREDWSAKIARSDINIRVRLSF